MGSTTRAKDLPVGVNLKCKCFSFQVLICSLVCLCLLRRMEKLPWRHWTRGRTAPRASCVTSAKTSQISRTRHIPVKAGIQLNQSATRSVVLSGKPSVRKGKNLFSSPFYSFPYRSSWHVKSFLNVFNQRGYAVCSQNIQAVSNVDRYRSTQENDCDYNQSPGTTGEFGCWKIF